MRIQARAKINWALQSTGLLPGGYHALDMLMESVSLEDTLEIFPADELMLTVDGEVAGDENLVMRAAKLLQAHTGCSLGAQMRLTKRIPARAGLGGGSADCAAAMAGLNQMWALGLSQDTLQALGLRLGADVPFCLMGGLCRARGRGEILTPLQPEKKACLLIAMGGDGLSTRDVFVQLDRKERLWRGDMEAAQAAVICRDLTALEVCAENSLYAPAVEISNLPGEIVADMYAMGAKMARMSGSGSACFGVFEDGEAARKALEDKYGFCVLCHTQDAGWKIEEE